MLQCVQYWQSTAKVYRLNMLNLISKAFQGCLPFCIRLIFTTLLIYLPVSNAKIQAVTTQDDSSTQDNIQSQEDIQTQEEILYLVPITTQDSSTDLHTLDQHFLDAAYSADTRCRKECDKTATIILTRYPDSGLDSDNSLNFPTCPFR